jgi:hypothetical protein
MAKSWENMSYHEKLEALRQDMVRVHAAVRALTQDQDETWGALKETRSATGKIIKDVATLRALWPYEKKYSRTG